MGFLKIQERCGMMAEANGKKRAKLEKAVFIASIVIIVVCWQASPYHMWQLIEIKQTAELELELAYWQEKLTRWSKAILETKDERRGIARERLGLVMPGETLYMPTGK